VIYAENLITRVFKLVKMLPDVLRQKDDAGFRVTC